MLLESQHTARMLTSMQMEEQNILAKLSSPKFKHDISLNVKLPKVREDAAQLMGILTVQTNIINAQIEKRYEFKFKSFETNDYGQQIQEHEDSLQRSEVRQQEGSEPRSDAGSTAEGKADTDASGGRQVTMAPTNPD